MVCGHAIQNIALSGGIGFAGVRWDFWLVFCLQWWLARYPTLECESPEFLQCLKLLTRRIVLSALQTRWFVTLKVGIVAVEEKAFQSLGLERDRIGHSFLMTSRHAGKSFRATATSLRTSWSLRVRSMYRRVALANAKNSCAGYFRFLSESSISKALEPAKRGDPLENRSWNASWIARDLQIGRT